MVEQFVEKLLSYGIGGIFLAYLLVTNWNLQKQVENLSAKHEVGTAKTVEALSKLTEVLSVFKAEVLGKLS